MLENLAPIIVSAVVTRVHKKLFLTRNLIPFCFVINLILLRHLNTDKYTNTHSTHLRYKNKYGRRGAQNFLKKYTRFVLGKSM